MKKLKYVLFLLFILIVGFLIYVAVQPNSYDVQRSQLIPAPAEVIYANINDIKKWDEWGPWHDEDSTITTTYSENTIGIGAKSSWTSKDGPGNMELVGTVPNKSVDLKMQFGDYTPSDVLWTFEETEGGTNVTWRMKNDDNPFFFKLIGVFYGGMEKMLGEMEENGLNNLSDVVAEEMKNRPVIEFRLGDIESIQLEPQKFIGYKQETTTDMDHEAMTKLFMEFMPKAGAYAMTQLTEDDIIPGSVYTLWDEENNKAAFYIGVLLKKDLAPAQGMTALDLPSGNGLKIAKFGNYGTGDYEAHMAIANHMEENNLEQNGYTVWELYVNDPTQVEPKDIQTDIYYAIK